jgi:hypothetical protein
MKRATSALLGAAVVAVCVAAAPSPPLRSAPVTGAASDTLSADSANSVFVYNCRRCHGTTEQRGNMSLAGFDVGALPTDAELAEKIIHKLRAGMMPPAGAKRPDPAILDALATTLETRIDAAAAGRPHPGGRTFQRLNRAEYARSIHDMLALDLDVDAFLPSETLSENFDNIADVQMLSPTLLEGYLRAASEVSRLAVGDPAAGPSSTTYKVPKTASQMVHVEGTPLGTRGGISVVHNFPADGDYVFELELHPEPTGNLYGLTSPDEKLEVSVNGERVALLSVDRWMSESDPTGMRMETPAVHVRAGPQRIAAAFIKKFEGPIDDLITPIDHTLADSQIGTAYGITTGPHLRDLTISGPFRTTGVSDTPSRRAIFACRPTSADEEEPCARRILTRLASRAYRRPIADDDLADLMRFYHQGQELGGFETGVRTALQAILSSPHFVFRLEEVPAGARPGEVYPIADMDMASRLSFFLWAEPPDDELIGLAREGKLSDPGTLAQQARRMLADPRADALGTRFAAQWLRLQDLDKIHPDAQLYPYYDARLADAMHRETELLFIDLVRNDRSLLDLITEDHTFVNERLARHYGIPDVVGDGFQRVALTDPNRRGLLGQGSILALTSHADRTSPVLRGKWVMEVLLGSPPPPPPPGVPAFDQTASAHGGRELTTRERMEEHRANPVCQSCHKVIDPIGLALDNFDVTGAWRIKENEVPVDAAGQLYDGTPLTGPADLRAALLGRKTVFVRTFIRNLMAYAIGRRVEYYDMPEVRHIEREAAANGYRMTSFILGVIESPAFRMSTAATVADGDAGQGARE